MMPRYQDFVLFHKFFVKLVWVWNDDVADLLVFYGDYAVSQPVSFRVLSCLFCVGDAVAFFFCD